MGAFFTPSLGTWCQESGVQRRDLDSRFPEMVHFAPPLLNRSCGCTFTAEKNQLSLSSPCGWVHLKLPKCVKSPLALTPLRSGPSSPHHSASSPRRRW